MERMKGPVELAEIIDRTIRPQRHGTGDMP
jgi:hypothetical protein